MLEKELSGCVLSVSLFLKQWKIIFKESKQWNKESVRVYIKKLVAKIKNYIYIYWIAKIASIDGDALNPSKSKSSFFFSSHLNNYDWRYVWFQIYNILLFKNM